jgi:protein-tyrosine phosphatase
MLDGVLDPATVEDAAAVVRLRDAAAEWLLSRGIEQWRPGELTNVRIAARAEAGELFVCRVDGVVAAAVVVADQDSAVWGAVAGDAGYVHTLVVDRRHAGRGLGRRVLAAVERLIATRHARARLDCVSTNTRLRAYYRDAGYREVGERDLGAGWSPVTLFEKRL